MDDEIELLGRQRFERAPMVDAPVLAAEETEAQLRHVGIRGRGGAEASDARADLAGSELVVVGASGIQAGDLVAHRAVVGAGHRDRGIDDRGAGQRRGSAERAGIVGGRHAQPDRKAGVEAGRRGIVDVRRHDAGPQQDAVRPRIARRHALREFPVRAGGRWRGRRPAIRVAVGVVVAPACRQPARRGHRHRDEAAQLQKSPSVHVLSFSLGVARERVPKGKKP